MEITGNHRQLGTPPAPGGAGRARATSRCAPNRQHARNLPLPHPRTTAKRGRPARKSICPPATAFRFVSIPDGQSGGLPVRHRTRMLLPLRVTLLINLKKSLELIGNHWKPPAIGEPARKSIRLPSTAFRFVSIRDGQCGDLPVRHRTRMLLPLRVTLLINLKK